MFKACQMHSDASTKRHCKARETLPPITKHGEQALQALAASIGTFQPARETVQPAIQRQAEPRLSYHDELEVNLRALLAEGSRR